MEGGRVLAWRSAVVPVPARGRVRVKAADDGDRVIDARERAIATMVNWCQHGQKPLWLVEGAASSGKTTFVNDVADRLVAAKWPCGWARPGLGAYAVTAAARNGRRALVLVDDAETRADMFDVLCAVINGGRPLSVRLIVAAREFGAWWDDLLARLSPAEREVLSAGRTVLGGGEPVTLSPSRSPALRDAARAFAAAFPGGLNGPNGAGQDLSLGGYDTSSPGSDVRGRVVNTLALADPVSPAVLLRQAAVVVALSTRVGQLGPADVRAAVRDLFEESEGYWQRTSTEVSQPGQPQPALRAAITSAAIVGSDGLADAATVLRRVPALAAGAADRLARLAVWWHGLFGRTGESEAATPRLPTWLADKLPDGTDRTGVSWTVAALDAERLATSTLNQLALHAHRDVWPGRSPSPDDGTSAHESLRRAVATAAPVDEALAWLIQQLELGPTDIESLDEAISYPTRSLSRTAIVLAKRLLEAAVGEDQKAHLTLALGARYSEVGDWAQARDCTEAAVAVYRRLVEINRSRHLANLATAVANFGSCLAQLGDREGALEQTCDAVGLYRELVEIDRDLHLPPLARALTNLSACLSRCERHQAAMGAAGEAVELYQELMELQPYAYQAEFAAAEHNLRVCREALGEPVAGRRPE